MLEDFSDINVIMSQKNLNYSLIVRNLNMVVVTWFHDFLKASWQMDVCETMAAFVYDYKLQ
jgi:hypothetical protein